MSALAHTLIDHLSTVIFKDCCKLKIFLLKQSPVSERKINMQIQGILTMKFTGEISRRFSNVKCCVNIRPMENQNELNFRRQKAIHWLINILM